MAEKKKGEPSIVLALMFFVLMFALVSVNATITFMGNHPLNDVVTAKIEKTYIIPANRFYNDIGFTIISSIINTEFDKFKKNSQIAELKENSIECKKVNHKFNTFQVIGSYFGVKNNKDYCGAIPTANAYMELNPVIFLSNFRYDLITMFVILLLMGIGFVVLYRKLSQAKAKVDKEILRYFAFIPPKDDLKGWLDYLTIQNPLTRNSDIINIDKLRTFVNDVLNGKYDNLAEKNEKLLQNEKQYNFAKMGAKIMRYMRASLINGKMLADPMPASISGHHNPDEKYGLLTHSLNVAYVCMLNLLNESKLDNYLEYFYGALAHDVDKIRNYRQKKAMPQNIVDTVDASGKNLKKETEKLLKERQNEWTTYGLDDFAQRNIFLQHCTGVFPSDEIIEFIKICDHSAIDSELIYTGLNKDKRHKQLGEILYNVIKIKKFREKLIINRIENGQVDIALIKYKNDIAMVFHENFFHKLSQILQEELAKRMIDYKVILQIPISAGKDGLMKMFSFYFLEEMMENMHEIVTNDNKKEEFIKNFFYFKNNLIYQTNLINGKIIKTFCVGNLKKIDQLIGEVQEDFKID